MKKNYFLPHLQHCAWYVINQGVCQTEGQEEENAGRQKWLTVKRWQPEKEDVSGEGLIKDEGEIRMEVSKDGILGEKMSVRWDVKADKGDEK